MRVEDAAARRQARTGQARVERRHPEVLALHELDLLAPARAGQKGALHPVAIASSFSNLLQLGLAKLRGRDFSDTPMFRLIAGQGSYLQVPAPDPKPQTPDFKP